MTTEQKEGFFSKVWDFFPKVWDFWQNDIGEDGKTFGNGVLEQWEILTKSSGGIFGFFQNLPAKIGAIFSLIKKFTVDLLGLFTTTWKTGNPVIPTPTDMQFDSEGKLLSFTLTKQINGKEAWKKELRYFEATEGDALQGTPARPAGYYAVENGEPTELWPLKNIGTYLNNSGITATARGSSLISLNQVEKSFSGSLAFQPENIGTESIPDAAKILLEFSEGEVTSAMVEGKTYKKESGQWKAGSEVLESTNSPAANIHLGLASRDSGK